MRDGQGNLARELFSTGATFLLDRMPYGTRTRIAEDNDLDVGYVSSVIKGTKTGSDKMRQIVADKVEWHIEDIYALGRHILSGRKGEEWLLEHNASPGGDVTVGSNNRGDTVAAGRDISNIRGSSIGKNMEVGKAVNANPDLAELVSLLQGYASTFDLKELVAEWQKRKEKAER